MNCERVRTLLPAYLDGELDLMTSLEIEEHLATCAECTRAAAEMRDLQSVLSDQRAALLHPTPPALKRRVRAALRQSAAPVGARRGALYPRQRDTAPVRHGPRAGTWAIPPWRGYRVPRFAPTLAAAALLLLLALLALGLTNGWPWVPHVDLLAQEVETAHVRSLMGSHLTDVTSTDQHTVKPWFDGKLDFSPPVVDPAAQGYPLTGGRLDYVDNHQAAALVYLRNKHVINLLIWPTTDAPSTALRQTTINGYHLVAWNQSGMTFWAVSDLEINELLDFVKLIRQGAG